MASYTYEKGKYGGPCGAIFPFFRQITGALPSEQDYTDYIPAGYLKCQGQILNADQFPELAEKIGVGEGCIYKKIGTTLSDRLEDGTGGSIQLPDLGSKYITTSGNPGEYLSSTVLNPTTGVTVDRAGVGVSLSSTAENIDFTYTGNFKVPRLNSLDFTGLWRTVSPPTATPEATVGIANFVAHGHRATFTIGDSINLNSKGMASGSWTGRTLFCYRSARIVCAPDANFGVEFIGVDITESGSESKHAHGIGSVVLSTNKSGNIPAVEMTATGLTTTVKTTTANVFKMDDIAPKFILCEYLIKY